jgi:HSP20 family protein
MAENRQQLARRDTVRDLESWDPFRMFPFRGLRMPQWADELLGEPLGGGRMIAPAVDVSETNDAYDISIEVPGVRREDLTIECKDGVLTVRGEKKSERDEKRASARIMERSYGAFSRAMTLPTDADLDNVDASYRDGVLHIELKKKPEAKPKTVEIKE